ncbi:hypothetical protein MI149_13965 [Mycolicibacterium crocinum]|uniref:Uncharacterized protein n=1 Tax=Mycolicibacterium crocinum TaxID=388459 RepID=A0ABY3TRN5_9MYCO|nr:hypothetical protein [Mycolicibacterium crocinum]ULN44071.2 hypothetical protein MI149_13965 [Mycolicibacterium crocinum]
MSDAGRPPSVAAGVGVLPTTDAGDNATLSAGAVVEVNVAALSAGAVVEAGASAVEVALPGSVAPVAALARTS